MEENDLQINITAVDEASGTLENVAAAADGMATSIDRAASSVSETLTTAFTAAEEAAIDSAMASAEAWMGAATDIGEAGVVTAEEVGTSFMDLDYAALTAANNASESWQASLRAIQEIGAMTAAEVDAEFASMGQSAEKGAEKANSSMKSMHGYFSLLIAGFMAQTAGKGLLGVVNDAVAAAAGDPTKLTDLTNQLREQQAQLQKLELPISGKGKTTATLWADEADQSAKIDSAKQKIKELQAQIAPLAMAQQIAGTSAQDYADATKNLTTAWQTFMATAGAPLLEHLAKAADGMAKIVDWLTKWAAAHPKLAETILLAISVLGVLLLVLGTIAVTLAPLIIVIGLFGGAVSVAAVASAAAFAAVIAALVFMVAYWIVNWNAILGGLQVVWDAIVNLVKNHWQTIVQVLLPGIGSVVVFFYNHWQTISKDIQTVWTAISKFILGIWDGIYSGIENIIGKIKSAISTVAAPINSIVGAVQGAGSFVGNVWNSAVNSIPHFANGGIVRGPTIGLIGEAGPEAIIPLSAFAGGNTLGGGSSGGQGNIVVNIGSLQGTDTATAKRFGDLLARSINQQLKLRTH